MLEPGRGFDWVFLVELLLCGALTIFFLFYFNRLFAALVSYGLRTYSWRKYHVYVDVEAIQVSLLAGRIFFKGFRYHGENETLLVHSGHVTWRYWYRKVKDIDCARSSGPAGKESPKLTDSHGEKGGIESSSRSLPCRLLVSINGLEWYLYNRSAAYDALVASILSQDESRPSSESGLDGAKPGPSYTKIDPKPSSATHVDNQNTRSSTSNPETSSIPFRERLLNLLKQALNASPLERNQEAQHSPVLPDKSVVSDFPLLKILPIQIICHKGAVVMGNESVRYILIVKFEKASGDIDASYCPPPDPCRQLINFQFTHPVMQMKPNLAHKESTSATAAEGKASYATRPSAETLPGHPSQHQQKPRKFRFFAGNSVSSRGGKLDSSQLISENVTHMGPKTSVKRRWRGLARYLDDDDNGEYEPWKSIEYGRCPTIIDSPRLSINYYWDVAGAVTQMDDSGRGPKSKTANINRGSPPKWGLDLAFEGGTVNYGPWADRHRFELQSIFFPRLFKDATPAMMLAPGEKRVSTAFKVFVELRDQMTLRIPTREPSKDSKWNIPGEEFRTSHKPVKGKRKKRSNSGNGSAGEHIRPFGWLDIKIPSDSTISYVMDMAATIDGFQSTLDLDFRGTEIWTSVNHGILWRSGSLKTACELPTPLKWNALHNWVFNISSDSPELFLLREHIILFSDLITDWSTGPPPDYYTFAPFEYVFNVTLRDLQLYLNVNDANIINNPCDLDDNTFTIIQVPSLESNFVVPLTKYRPDWNELPFQVNARHCQINSHLPPWKTQSAFFGSGNIGTLKAVSLRGRYGYYTSVSPGLTDTLILDIHGCGPSLDLFGFMVRYFIKIKDNYFGEDIHFKTLEEYQHHQANKDIVIGDADDAGKMHNRKNGLDVILNIEAVDAHVKLPANLYAAKDGVQISFACLNADLRFTNYYMDLAVKFSPLLASAVAEKRASTEVPAQTSETELFVDGIDIHGHRLFGLPPTEPTYMCNWDFHVGKVTGDCSVEFLRKLSSGVRSFSFTVDDEENSLPPVRSDIIPDVTFLRARLQSLHVWLHVGYAAFLLSTSAVMFNFNDWATTSSSKRIDLRVPKLRIDCLSSEPGSNQKEVGYRPSYTDGHLETALTLSMIEKSRASTEFFQRQQQHIEKHDQWTSRSIFLQRFPKQDDCKTRLTQPDRRPPVIMPLPPMPAPITDASNWLPARASRNRVRMTSSSPNTSSRRSSFLLYSLPRNASTSTRHTSKSSSSNPGSAAFSVFSRAQISRRIGVAPRQDILDPSPHGPTFSSSFLTPRFPHWFSQPSTDNIPHLPSQDTELDSEDTPLPPSMTTSKAADEDCTHSALIVRFGPGLIVAATPQAVTSSTQLLRQLQATDPAEMLDELQVDVMSKVSELAKPGRSIRKILDLDVKLPYLHLRFGNTHLEAPSVSDRHTEAEYNVLLRSLSAALRFISRPNRPDTIEDAKKLTTLYARLDSIEISVGSSSTGVSRIQPAIRGAVEDIVFQFYEDKILSATLHFNGLELATQSRQMGDIAGLLQRVRLYAQEVSREFSCIAEEKSARVRALVFFLISKGKNIPDPASLTRPSYVLRTAPDHLRLSDSWKIISRLRQIYQTLSINSHDEFDSDLSVVALNCPVDAENQVIESLNKWRSWELAHVKQSYVMQRLYRPRNRSALATNSGLPFNVLAEIRAIKILVDPGPNQSEVDLDVLVVCVKNSLPEMDTESAFLSSPPNPRRPTTVIEIHSEKTMIRLNWELCELTTQFPVIYPKDPATDRITPGHSRSSHAAEDNEYQIVYVTKAATVTFDSPNIKYMAAYKSLQGSILTYADVIQQSHMVSMTVLVTAATSEFLSHGRLLATSKVVQPNLVISQQRRASDGKPVMNTKVAVTCKELSCAIEEEISSLMQCIDLIVGNEFARLQNLLGRSATHPESDQPREIMDRDSSNSQFEAACLMDTYRLSVALIPSLSYVMSGRATRASILPRSKSDYVFDFDLKEQLHQTLVQKGAGKESLSALHVPAVNGHVVGGKSKLGNRCQILISVDPVKIEAAAISNFLITVNRPELTHLTKEVARDWKSIRTHIDQTLDSHAQSSLATSGSAKLFVYDCSFAISGIKVHAIAPNPNVGSETCEIELNLGSVHIRASSNTKPQSTVLGYPDVQFALPHISADLTCCQGPLRHPCGKISLGLHVGCSSMPDPTKGLVGSYHAKVNRLQIDLFPETASTAAYIVGHLQGMIKGLDFSREAHYLRKLRNPKPPLIDITPSDNVESQQVETDPIEFSAVYSLEILSTQIKWIVGPADLDSASGQAQDLVLKTDKIDLVTKEGKAARLKMEVLQLQMVPPEQPEGGLSRHSALLPEVVFNVAYLSHPHNRKLAFQAAGKLLELRFTSQFIIPATSLQRSVAAAFIKLKEALASWDKSPSDSGGEEKLMQANKSLMSVLVDADFAGAVVYVQGTETLHPESIAYQASGSKLPHRGRHEPSHGDSGSTTTLRAPGVAVKMEYKADARTSSCLNGEVRINSSTNTLYPSFVPLILEITSSIKDVISKSEEKVNTIQPEGRQERNREEDSILQPEGILGRCKLNVGLRICKQEFTLSCQPIAKVTASAGFEDVYITVNTVESPEYGQFFAISAIFSQIQAAVKHVYSRESTGNFEVETISLSVMNSKHLSGTSGISAILRVGLTKASINARQVQDFLLFRDLWIPADVHTDASSASLSSAKAPQAYLVQRSHEVAAASAVPWDLAVVITELKLQMDFGQALGRSCLTVSNLWSSSRKSSDWEQNLCLGFDKFAIHGSGRLSELVELQTCKIRTSIQWPSRERALVERPLVEAAVSFDRLLVKVAFDHQIFLVAKVNSFGFFMFNVRDQATAKSDRLVATLDGDEVHVSCTATSAAQGIALYQAILRLVQEKRAALEASLQEVQRYIKRRSNIEGAPQQPSSMASAKDSTRLQPPASLATDVVVVIKALSVSVFPNTVFDNQIFKVEMQNARACFAVMMHQGRIHSRLGLTLGQLRIAVSVLRRIQVPAKTEEVDIDQIVNRATGSRDGTILKVPRVVADMRTWQDPDSNHIDYIFRSSFEGKVDVGWNYSRIGFIRGLWSSHSRALSQRLGKPLSQPTVKITGGPRPELAGADADIVRPDGEPEKITAVVNVPQSRYEYRALETPVIETPQLRDMGEATPPLEWIGFQRDRLPNLTHQLIIVALLKVTREVEDAYSRILGSS